MLDAELRDRPLTKRSESLGRPNVHSATTNLSLLDQRQEIRSQFAVDVPHHAHEPKRYSPWRTTWRRPPQTQTQRCQDLTLECPPIVNSKRKVHYHERIRRPESTFNQTRQATAHEAARLSEVTRPASQLRTERHRRLSPVVLARALVALPGRICRLTRFL